MPEFKRLAEAAPLIIGTAHADGRVRHLNAAWYRYTGLSPEESLDFGWIRSLHPAERGSFFQRYAAAVASGETLDISHRLLRHDGVYRWFTTRMVPVVGAGGGIDAWIGATFDVHEQKVALTRLAAINDLQSRVAAAGDDRAEVVRRVLAGVAALTASDGAALERVDGEELVYDATYGSLSPWNGYRLRVEGSLSGHCLRERKAAKSDDVAKDPRVNLDACRQLGVRSLALVPFEVEGDLECILKVVSGRKGAYDDAALETLSLIGGFAAASLRRARLFDDVLRLADELERARDAAENASRAKSAFLANMSHEMRTPLGVIVGFGELLKDPSLSAEERLEFLEAITRNAGDLSRLIDDILDLSKVEADKLDVELLPVSLPRLVEEVLRSLGGRAREKGIALTARFDDDVPEWVVSDPSRLRQILLNVVGNAVKFTEKGQVSIRVRRASESGIQFVIEDTGIGLDEEAKSKVFAPFVQADPSTTRRYGGTGLGLGLARKLARALGGDVHLAGSEPGKGSTFVVTVEVRDLARPPQEDGSGDRSRPREPEKGLAGLRVLVVEDSEDNQDLARLILQRAGASVEIVDNGAEAVRRALENRPDVVLMDIQMPVLDGYGATSALRRSGFERPIIALTAHAMASEREKSLEAGCDEHLTKPIDRIGLVEAISSVLRR